MAEAELKVWKQTNVHKMKDEREKPTLLHVGKKTRKLIIGERKKCL